MTEHDAPTPETPLESWKEIAAYLNRDARTVRRWEKAEGLPVHRHRHLARSSVYAFPRELDAWRAGRRPVVTERPTPGWPILRLGPAMALVLVTVAALGGGRFLGSTSVSAQEPQLRRVWTGDRDTTILRDGREITYDADQNLVMRGRDGRVVALTSKDTNTTDHPAGWLASRDEHQLVFTWYREAINRYELRLVALGERGAAGSRVILDSPEVNIASPLDWSPDGRALAVELSRKDRTLQLALVNVQDASVRVLKTSAWGSDVVARFSPDGRFLAVNDGGDVATLAVDDLRRSIIAGGPGDEHVLGWSPDGRFVIVTSDRRGTNDLFVIPVDDGRATDEPRLVYRELGSMVSLGVTDAGVLRLEASGTDVDVVIHSLDLQAGVVGAAVVPARRRRLGSNEHPDWSADGRFLAYVSRRPDGDPAIVIEESDSGEFQREVPIALGYPNWLRWSPDGNSFAVSATDDKGRIGVFLVDAVTARTAVVATPRDDFWRGFRPEWSPDGRRIYYSIPAAVGIAVVEHEVASGIERPVFHRRGRVAYSPSPDGRWLAATSDDRRALQLLSLNGAVARDLLGPEVGRTLGAFLAWTPASAGVLILARPAEGNADAGLWHAPLAAVPQRLSGPGLNGPFRIRSDGRRLAGVRETERREIWHLENFLPDAKQ